MSSNSEMLGNHGAKHSFDFEDKHYELRYLDQVMKDEFEKNLFRRDRRLCEINSEGKAPEELKAAFEELNRKFRIGEYAFESPDGLAFMQTNAGVFYLFCLMSGSTSEEALKILTTPGKGQEVMALVELVLAESLPSMKKAKKHPNSKAPAKK